MLEKQCRDYTDERTRIGAVQNTDIDFRSVIRFNNNSAGKQPANPFQWTLIPIHIDTTAIDGGLSKEFREIGKVQTLLSLNQKRLSPQQFISVA